ncbi:FAD-binding oxidoreductase [Aggregatimonas sangjinii]|uniref:FAD-binding oxidoreductase n=1 Tax=Aggregatimonas sangjinii TaxID=2583587 RepID=A0A5B7SY57_9FLAO|nr:FAD-dependent oxidoreductase [Aggregatimonas sangjinii]QCX02008.1 FAD-binding oxidoreductase [Aggregatimonas sangjinii]
MNLSYWEYKTWLYNVDFTIIGSGIVGLNTALSLSIRFPKAKILVLEKGILPQGASTKNAGFACFGSISEVLSDLRQHSEQEVQQLVQKRYDGIRMLRKNLGDAAIDFQQLGGHELFVEKGQELFEECMESISKMNELLYPVFGVNAFQTNANSFRFKNINEQYITNVLEGQIDTGKMMVSLLRKVQQNNVQLLNGVSVEEIDDNGGSVTVKTDQFEFNSKKILMATNGFAAQLLQEDIQPARAQVILTKPIQNLHIKGTFHLDEGYYYFRNIDNRILFGGGRNLDIENETTYKFGKTDVIQKQLKKLLKEVILPETQFELDRSWSGIMGVGNQKRPIVKQVSNNVYCGVRLGGMGIAIGSSVGNELADLID